MKRLKNNETIKIWGVSFDGIKDMVEHARSGEPKNGVYVGDDSQHYPCFDSEDYMYENRYYTNLVFAKSQEELVWKLDMLTGMIQLKCNYNKLTGKLHPMVYWEGDTYHDVYLTEADDE